MSRYTVLWLRDAQDELARIWLTSSNRNSVTRAVAQIDAMLANAPAERGEEVCQNETDPVESRLMV
jgi:hypothetical protein